MIKALKGSVNELITVYSNIYSGVFKTAGFLLEVDTINHIKPVITKALEISSA